jgi:hypothetical protein
MTVDGGHQAGQRDTAIPGGHLDVKRRLWVSDLVAAELLYCP